MVLKVATKCVAIVALKPKEKDESNVANASFIGVVSFNVKNVIATSKSAHANEVAQDDILFKRRRQKHNFQKWKNSLFLNKTDFWKRKVLKYCPKDSTHSSRRKTFPRMQRASDVPKSLFCKVPVFSKQSKVRKKKMCQWNKKSSKFPISLDHPKFYQQFFINNENNNNFSLSPPHFWEINPKHVNCTYIFVITFLIIINIVKAWKMKK